MATVTPDSNSDSTALATRDDNQVSRPSGVADAAPQKNVRPAELKWAEVQSAFLADLKEQGKGSQEKNFRTTFKFFLEAIGKTGDCQVGEELTEEFEATLVIFVKYQKKRGCKKGTYVPRLSKIKRVKQFVEDNYTSSLARQTPVKSFGKKLLMLITAIGHSIRSFWLTLPEGLVPYNTLNHWCRGKHYLSIKYLPVVKTLESYLGVPEGTLRTSQYRLLGRGLKYGQSDSGNKTRAALSKPYGVWTESLEGEFKELSIHKTRGILPEGEERSELGQWTSSEGGKIMSAVLIKGILRTFMGFCALPEDAPDPYLRGVGINLDRLSLALLADKRLVEGYLEFMKLRSGLRVKPVDPSTVETLPAHKISANGLWEYYDKGGKYNQGSIQFLNMVSSLLHPKSGHLYQHREYAEKLGPRMVAETWEQQCAETRGRVNALCNSILKMKKASEGMNEDGLQDQEEDDVQEFELGRDPKKIIQWILDLERPLHILHEMIKAMIEDLLPEDAPELERARQYRDLLLVLLLCANPLRIVMFSRMKFKRNLIREGDGSWWIRFNKRAFKNRKSLKTLYRVRVAEELWPVLDRYKEEFHPILVGSTGSEYVFVSGLGRIRQGEPMSAPGLSELTRKLTELYLPGDLGFRPHAFRHIIATDIIKTDPRWGFNLASIALHDKYETVLASYAHLKTSEIFEPVNSHFSESWRTVFGASALKKAA